jgi:hypothetical protein
MLDVDQPGEGDIRESRNFRCRVEVDHRPKEIDCCIPTILSRRNSETTGECIEDSFQTSVFVFGKLRQRRTLPLLGFEDQWFQGRTNEAPLS